MICTSLLNRLKNSCSRCFCVSVINTCPLLCTQTHSSKFFIRPSSSFSNTSSKKELHLNDILYERFSNHIGKFPCVVIAPDDIEIITGSSDERRKFIDTVLSQMNPGYLQQLIVYNKILQQRNSLLKNFNDSSSDHMLLEVLDKQLIEPALNIYLLRTAFCKELIPLVQAFYIKIAGTAENIEMLYESQLCNDDFAGTLMASRAKDILLQRTTTGIHKDDLCINLDGRIFKNMAS